MISQAQINRLVEGQQYARLVQRILDNGRPCSSRVRQRLTGAVLAPVAGLSLAVQRFIELNFYSRSLEGDRLVRRLLTLQQPDGLFGPADASDDDRLVATAFGLRALVDHLAADAGGPESERPDLNGIGRQHESAGFSAAVALQRGAEALIARNGMEGMLGGDPETASIIDWQLGDGPQPTGTRPHSILQQMRETATRALDNRDTPLADAA